jgi:biopolymer transport protein ExbD
MRFKKNQNHEPEINLIPFIDVLLVVLIFLMLSTTYSKLTELDLTLPSANASNHKERSNQINLLINSDGDYFVQSRRLNSKDLESLSQALSQASQNLVDPLVIISADARTTHQSVIQALEAAQQSGLKQVTFATQAVSPSAPFGESAPTSAPLSNSTTKAIRK